MNDEQKLVVWTVYEKPADYPAQFVARRFAIQPAGLAATREIFVADTLDEVRALLPPELVCVPRAESDPPMIVESWL